MSPPPSPTNQARALEYELAARRNAAAAIELDGRHRHALESLAGHYAARALALRTMGAAR